MKIAIGISRPVAEKKKKATSDGNLSHLPWICRTELSYVRWYFLMVNLWKKFLLPVTFFVKKKPNTKSAYTPSPEIVGGPPWLAIHGFNVFNPQS